jgi:glycosyltransferase involved in cell wall biosynthesis
LEIKELEVWAGAGPACYDAARVRILLDYRPALRQRTGVGRYVHELATALHRQLGGGETLTLFSSSWKDRLRPAAIPGAGIVDKRIPVRLLNLAWHRLGFPAVEHLAGRIDIAHSAHPLLMPARAGTVRAVTVYDLDFLDHPERSRAEIRRDYPRLAATHARRADLVVVISEHTARQVRERLHVPAERIVLCRPGAPARSPRPSPGSEAGPILFVGTVEPRKNLPTLFAAYEQVIARRPSAPPLVIAGGTVEHSASILGDLRARAALGGRVELRGYVSDAERQALYARASMLVLPSLEEGFGMTAVEAMQAGLPVVASTAGALPEVIGNAGIVLDPGDTSGFAAAIERLLDDGEERGRLVTAGYEQAKRFSWDASAATLLAAYRQAVANRNQAR